MHDHATWYEKFWGWVVGIFVAWINYNHGATETIYKYLDAVIMTAFCGIVGGIITYLTRKFCAKYFGDVFKKTSP